ncbi:MAG: hypothetical protein P8074_10245 [Anaerolineales bacterium]|jgi:hypothetical protein
MKRTTYPLIALVLLLSMFAPVPANSAVKAAGNAWTIPTFSIVSVVADKTVTIKTYNFPANDSFDVLMGQFGTRGINGIKVTSVSSGSGGSFTATYDIPAALQGLYRIAIRLQSNTGSGYFAYNWFYNNTTGSGTGTGTTPSTGYSGYPTFSIQAVVRDKTVTVRTNNLPANQDFKVLMGPMGTRGINGYQVTTFDTGSGGAQTLTFDIPSQLAGSYQISIRMQSISGSGLFAYNWFYNNTTGSGTGGGTTTPPSTVYSGFPTFSIQSVVRNQTVTVRTHNLPPNETFKVLMGPMGTRGINGYQVTTFDTGSGGAQTLTFDIPSQLAGSYQISIRMQSISGSGLFAYNWFYNNTAY